MMTPTSPSTLFRRDAASPFGVVCLALLATAALGCSDDPGAATTADTTVDDAADTAETDDVASDDTTIEVDSAAEDAGPPLSACESACKQFESCYADLVEDECVSLCEKPATAEKTKGCLESSNHCTPLAKCLGIEPTIKRAFDAATPGFANWDRAGDFFVKTARGNLSFSQRWTGADNWFFVARSGGYSYTENLWNSPLTTLFANLPKNSHIVFTAFKDKEGADNVAKHMGDIKTSFDQAVATLPDVERWHWSKRVHFVMERMPLPNETASPDHAGGWIGDMAAARGRFCFAVDNRQRVRPCGNLRFPPNGSGVTQELATLAYVARHFNFEDARQETLDAEKDVTEITVFKDLGTTSKLIRYATLPDATEMTKFNNLALDLTVNCVNHDEGDCAIRSDMVHVAVCDLPTETTGANDVACNTEIGRWSLPDLREGRWVSDATPMLAALANGGKRKFMLWTPEQTFKDGSTDKFVTLKYDLKLRFRKSEATTRPTEIVPLWVGNLGEAVPFDQTYNPAHLAQKVAIPAGAKKVELVALITGHGWGANDENCATFCKQKHAFSVGGKEFSLDHDNAGESSGCVEMAGKGMTPTQFSNWQYGRAGWCTGMDVRPLVADITSAVKPGSDAMISYQALYEGKPYTPKKKKDPASGAFDAEMLRTVYLVIHK